MAAKSHWKQHRGTASTLVRLFPSRSRLHGPGHDQERADGSAWSRSGRRSLGTRPSAKRRLCAPLTTLESTPSCRQIAVVRYPGRNPGAHIVPGLRDVRRIPHAVDVRVPSVVRRLRLGLWIEDRGERALRRVVGPHGVAHDLTEGARVDEVAQRRCAAQVVVRPADSLLGRAHVDCASRVEREIPGHGVADDDEAVAIQRNLLVEAESLTCIAAYSPASKMRES